jgi:hypothetical protein
MAGFQSYSIEGGKLVETWLSIQPIGSSWADTIAQEHWTSKRHNGLMVKAGQRACPKTVTGE